MTHEAPSPESLLEHRDWLRAIARSLVRDENVVDDVEQRTWLTVLRNRRPVTSARGWLRRVVRSAAVDEHRSDSRRRAREEASARPEALPPTDHLVMEVEAQRAVAQAVAGLPEPYRTTVLLRYIEELPVRDVAARMGVPERTVETRLRRALALLREALDREFGDRRAWCLVLLPLAKDKAPIAIGTATAGALAMAAKTKVVAAVAALALLATGIVWTVATGPGTPPGPSGESAAAGGTNATTHEQPAGPRFAVAGRVRSRRDGHPVAGAHVTLGRGPRGAIAADTAADGTFRIDDAAAGTLRVSAPRFRNAAVEMDAVGAGGQVVDLGDVWLDGSAALVVEVLGPGDARIERADVALVRRRHPGEIATTHSYLREVADPDAGITVVGSARTGADGLARFEDIVPGVHEVAVRAAGYAASGSGWVEVPPEQDETRKTVRVVRGYRVAGRVVTAAGEPAPGRLVDTGAQGWDERGFARTDAEGRFVLEDVPAGDVEFRVGRARGWNPLVAVVRVPDVPEVELRLPPMGAVGGRVTLADGSPVSDAEVGVETYCGWNQNADACARTDADGRWRIDEMPAGPLGRFVVRHPGLYHVGPHLSMASFVERRGGKETGIDARVPADSELRIDATMAKGSRLHGRVAGPDGPVAGAWVYLHMKPTKAGQEWETAIADAGGRYEFDFLPPGPAAAVPLHPAYVHPDTPEELGTELAAGTLSASLTFDLPEGGDVERDFTMTAGTRVAGRVTGPSGDPVVGANVRLESMRYSSPPTPVAVTDTSGAFVMDSVSGIGKSKLRVEAAGLAQTNVPEVELRAAGRVEGVEVRMASASRVAGHVSDADGGAVADARVTIAQRGARPVVAWTDATGAYAANVPWLEGKTTVSASREGGAAAQVEVEMAAGGAVADVRLAAMSEVAGRVTDSDGRPLAGAVVLTTDASKGIHWNYGDLLSGTGGRQVVRARTDEEGRFRVTLPAGAWALVAQRDGFVDEAAVIEMPTAAEAKLVLRAAATLTGILRSEDGRPLAGAVVVLEPGGEVQSRRISIPAYDPSRLQPSDHLLLRHTDASGAFRFPGIPEGPYALIAVLPTADSQQAREVRFGPLRPSGGPYDLTLSAPLSNALAGRLVDAGGAAFSDARITIIVIPERDSTPGDPRTWPRQAQAVAAADGCFRLEALTAPSYTLQVSVLSQPAPTTSPSGATRYRKSQKRAFHGLRPPITDLVLEMTELPRLKGRLVDDAGAPLGRWVITTTPGRDRTLLQSTGVTADDGTFDIRDVEEADYGLLVRSDGQPDRRVVLTSPVRGGTDVGDVVATLEARIRGRVVDAKGAAVSGAKVALYPHAGGVTQTLTTGADGEFEATGLDPSTKYNVGVAGADGKLPWEANRKAAEGVRPGTDDLRLVRE